jgi:hypothetical protein
MAYAQFTAEQLLQELQKRDKELADARKKNPEASGSGNNAPQIIYMSPSVPLPALESKRQGNLRILQRFQESLAKLRIGIVLGKFTRSSEERSVLGSHWH